MGSKHSPSLLAPDSSDEGNEIKSNLSHGRSCLPTHARQLNVSRDSVGGAAAGMAGLMTL